MSERVFDRETLLDLTVNVIPLGIILFFVPVFLIITPWRPDFFTQLISMALLVVPFVALAMLTYFSGRAIAQAEEAQESAAAIDDSFDDSPAVESGSETGANAEMTDGVTDDEAAAIDDGTDANDSDTAESGNDESTESN